MALDREAIFSALMARLEANVEGVKFFTRSVTEWRNASASKQPALLLVGGDESPRREQPGEGYSQPPVWTLSPRIHVYARNADSKDDNGRRAPDVQINTIASQVEAALERQSGEMVMERWHTTLGGTCLYCVITGTSRVQGEAQEEAELAVDLEIVALGT